MTELRNIAIIAHVDHGKTTLVDAMLRQAGVFRQNQDVAECVMDSNDLERERGITIFAKNASIEYGGVKINIVDTPGHADFGGEVERILGMVDGVILLVDAAEGPMPQTRFVLQKSMESGLTPVVLINKIDKPDARLGEVEDEILDLFISLGGDDVNMDYPVLYGSGRAGYMNKDSSLRSGDLLPLFDTILSTVPPPKCKLEGPVQVRIANLEHSDYVGRQGIGRVERGTIKSGATLMVIHRDGSQGKARVNRLEVFSGLGRRTVDAASAGDIVIVAGFEDIDIGETICDLEQPEALPVLAIDEPTISVEFKVNDSPFAGREGKFVTSRNLRDRLFREALYDRALRVEETGSADTFKISGRGELHICILIEKMRREGYEFAVSRPEVLLKEEDGQSLEPLEELICDLPQEYAGTIIERIGRRKGTMMDMRAVGDRTRLTFDIPTRGIVGFRTEFLSATRGEGVMNHRKKGWCPYQGEIAQRQRGALIALEQCDTVAYGMFQLQDRGDFFLGAGVPVYGGMVVGEHSRPGDLVINVGRTKKLTNVRASGTDDAVTLTPPRVMGLEQFLEFINDDELIEITPQSIRPRKRLLDPEARKREDRKRKAVA